MPYAHYILARQGKGQPVAIRSLLENFNYDQRYESEYMLKTALYLSGDRTYEDELKSLIHLNKVNNDYYRWSFRTQLRSYGLILALHQEMFGSNEAAEALAMNIHNKIVEFNNRYLHTRFGMDLLCPFTTCSTKLRLEGTRNIVNGTAMMNSSNQGNRSWMVWDSDRNNNDLELKANGTGLSNAFTKGVKADGEYELVTKA